MIIFDDSDTPAISPEAAEVLLDSSKCKVYWTGSRHYGGSLLDDNPFGPPLTDEQKEFLRKQRQANVCTIDASGAQTFSTRDQSERERT